MAPAIDVDGFALELVNRIGGIETPFVLFLDVDETSCLLRDKRRLALEDEEISKLHRRTEGWVAALQLAALSLAARHDYRSSGLVKGIMPTPTTWTGRCMRVMKTPKAVADALKSPPTAPGAQSPIGTKGLAETIRGCSLSHRNQHADARFGRMLRVNPRVNARRSTPYEMAN